MTDTKNARRIAWGLSGVSTIIWLIAVLVFGLGHRVLTHWAAAATMLVGSFLAGSSPEGGSAIAYPVFTKGLHISGPVARTFGLAIQAVGMTMAVISVLLYRRSIHARAAVLTSVAAVIGFLVSTAVFGNHGYVFWPSSIGTPWVKATFSIVLATTSFLMVCHARHGHHLEPLEWSSRLDLGVVLVGLAGGLLSSLTGTGANILIFLFLVVLADVNPKVALPTAIIVMTAVSIVGFVLFGLFDGQLDVSVVGERVVSVGSHVTSLDAHRFDLLGLWMAAVPIVVWGAPLGSLVASKVNEVHLVSAVAVLAATEVITTFILVTELRTDSALVAYMVLGLLVLPTAFVVLRANRRAVFSP